MTLQPRPTAGPLTAATTGTRQRIMLSTSSRPSAITSRRSSRSSAIRWRRSKSPPAENARPSPVMTATRASASALRSGKTRASPRCRSSFTALSCSGRASRTMRTGPSVSTRIASGRAYSIGLLFGCSVRSDRRQAENARGDDVLLDLGGSAHHALRAAVQVDLQPDVIAVDHRFRSGQLERCRSHGLLDPGHQELVDGAAGALVETVEALGEPAADVQSQHLRLHVGPGDGLALVAPERARIPEHDRLEVLDRLRVARDVADLAGLPLVADDGHRDAPAFAGLADQVVGRDARAVEHHLTELLGDAVDHAKRALLDPRLTHRHGEGGEALVLRDAGIGAREQEAPVCHVGVAGPDLVAVDHVLAAVTRGAGAERREVGAGIGLAEALAPALATADQPG